VPVSYTHALTGEQIESTWDRHPAQPGKARIWRRDDGVDTEYQWFFMLPNNIGSVAHTWEQALAQAKLYFITRWLEGVGLF
jgi:hypothetical protein